MRVEPAIEAVEASYRLTVGEQDWLAGLAHAMGPLSQGSSIIASVMHVGRRVEVVARTSAPHDPGLEALTNRIERLIPMAHRRKQHVRFGCETASGFARSMFGGRATAAVDLLYRGTLYPFGFRDVFNVQAADPAGWAVWCTMALRETTPEVHPRVVHTWKRVAVHMLAGFRLRRALGERAVGALDAAEAIFDPGGRCIHAAGQGVEPDARDALTAAVRAVDRARRRGSGIEPEEAVELWQGLFLGRWSVADVLDSDGRRYYVAVENEHEVAEDRRLTRREGQVATLAALGRDDACIAYEMGLNPSTVRTHLERSLRKLGLRERGHLIGLAGSLLPSVPSKAAHKARRESTPSLSKIRRT